MAGKWTPRVLWGLSGLLILATLLPLIRSNEWWIRIFDFPRAQIAVALTVAIATLLLFGRMRGKPAAVLMAGLVGSLAYQIVQIWPYSPLHPDAMARAETCAPGERLRLVNANVLQTNRDAAPLLALLRRERPDAVLLTETDAWWVEQLRPLFGDYPHRIAAPLPNTYGMTLLSRLPLRDGVVRTLVEQNIPSLRTTMVLPSGREVEFHGVHPRPPVPGHDTAARDAELVLVGAEVRRRARPTVIAGDFNDVAWSRTTALFQEVSGLIDPRVGRTLLPTYPASLPGLRWQLDYVFASPAFELTRMARLGRIGSDHLPVLTELCAARLDGTVPPSARPRLDAEERQRAREVVAEGREEVRED